MSGRRSLAVLTALVLLAVPALARASEGPPRPVARGELVASVAVAAPVPMRPRARPDVAGAEAAVASDAMRPRLRPASAQVISAAARTPGAPYHYPDTSPRPWARPDGIVEQAMAKRRKKQRGSVCGDVEIQGEEVGRVPGRIAGCGIEDAVAITSVQGIALSRPATMTCDTARALNHWVAQSVIPTFRRRGPVVGMRVAAHYACRTRNNQKGGRISEHGKGRAIDISAFTMKDGEVITVLEGWKRGATRRMLQRVHKEACGPFGTVLGPGSDGYHRDHLHLDTAAYRSGPYCR